MSNKFQENAKTFFELSTKKIETIHFSPDGTIWYNEKACRLHTWSNKWDINKIETYHKLEIKEEQPYQISLIDGTIIIRKTQIQT